MLSKDKKYRLANLEKVKEGQRRWYQANKEKAKQKRREYYYNNKPNFAERDAKRRVAKRQNFPKWADESKIKLLYYIASVIRSSGLNVQIDHIIPLRGKTVSGLHVENNLQISSIQENKRKGNFYWPDMWGAA